MLQFAASVPTRVAPASPLLRCHVGPLARRNQPTARSFSSSCSEGRRRSKQGMCCGVQAASTPSATSWTSAPQSPVLQTSSSQRPRSAPAKRWGKLAQTRLRPLSRSLRRRAPRRRSRHLRRIDELKMPRVRCRHSGALLSRGKRIRSRNDSR